MRTDVVQRHDPIRRQPARVVRRLLLHAARMSGRHRAAATAGAKRSAASLGTGPDGPPHLVEDQQSDLGVPERVAVPLHRRQDLAGRAERVQAGTGRAGAGASGSRRKWDWPSGIGSSGIGQKWDWPSGIGPRRSRRKWDWQSGIGPRTAQALSSVHARARDRPDVRSAASARARAASAAGRSPQLQQREYRKHESLAT